jgi:anti-anti-sigma factor
MRLTHAAVPPRTIQGELVPQQRVLLTVDGERLDPARYRVTAAGEIDLSSADTLAEACEHALRLPIASLELDLGDVTFVDSTGIRCLVDCRRRCSTLGVRLEVDSGPDVDRALTLVGLVFPGIGSRRASNGA